MINMIFVSVIRLAFFFIFTRRRPVEQSVAKKAATKWLLFFGGFIDGRNLSIYLRASPPPRRREDYLLLWFGQKFQ